jgi:plasmid rolling circle replication initiator protein Rep
MPKKGVSLMKEYNQKKMKNQQAAIFTRKHKKPKTQDRIEHCSDWIEFLKSQGEGEKMRWERANACKCRFCPLCSWRKTKKDAIKISTMMKYLVAVKKVRFLFVTLTAPNVKGDKLSEEITRYNKAFAKMMERKEFTAINKGYVRKLEVTYNKERDDYHPHFHCIIAVSSGYFSKPGGYIKQEKWLNAWRDVMNDPSITQVDVRTVKDMGEKSNAIAEIAKYSAKDADYLQSQEVFDAFYNALNGRQLLTFNRFFKDAAKLYENDALDDYITTENVDWYWLILQRWKGDEYSEGRFRKLTKAERKLAQMGKRIDDISALKGVKL